GTPVRPLHCKEHPNVSGCNDAKYDYVVTDGVSKISNKSYQDEAKLNCEDVVEHRSTPVHASRPNAEGGGKFCGRSDAKCRKENIASVHFKKCNQMEVIDNKKNMGSDSLYKKPMLESLKTSTKANLATYNKVFFSTNS